MPTEQRWIIWAIEILKLKIQMKIQVQKTPNNTLINQKALQRLKVIKFKQKIKRMNNNHQKMDTKMN